METPDPEQEPLRLLYLVFNRSGRGTYWRALGFGQALARSGHAVTLLSAAQHVSDGISEKEAGGLREVQFPDLHRGSGYDPWHILQRLRWLRRHANNEQFDLVHLFETRPVNLFPACICSEATVFLSLPTGATGLGAAAPSKKDQTHCCAGSYAPWKHSLKSGTARAPGPRQ